MTQNNETQNQGQADFNKSQGGGGGEPKQGREQDQTLSQNKSQSDQELAGQEDKSFQQAGAAEGNADPEAQQYAKGGQQDIESEETEIDDEDDTQADTSAT